MRLAAFCLMACLACTAQAMAAGLVPPQRSVSDDQARLALARELAWRGGPGDMAEARRMLGALLERHPGDAGVLEAVADLEAARGHYAAARDFSLRAEAAAPGDQALRLRTAGRMLLWGETGRAVRRWREALAADPGDAALLLGLGRSLRAAQRLHEAEAVAEEAVSRAATDASRREASLLLARVRLDAKRPRAALDALAGLPDDLEANRLRDRARPDAGAEPDLAGAEAAYRAALAADPADFRARMGLAEVLAARGETDAALAELDALARAVPASDKVALTRARVLAWDRRYDESLAAYAAISERDPGNPVPRREAARTAYWDKRADLGDELYASVPAHLPDSAAAGAVDRAVSLEREAKRQAFKGRFLRAMGPLERLSDVEPGNEEALFDLAQAQCALGLCDREADTYRRLLDVDPLHNLAGEALARQEIRSSPAVFGGWSFWHEDGRGDLADMARQRGDLTVEIPMACRHEASLTQHYWMEDPGGGFAARQAEGQTLEGRVAPAPGVALAGAVTRKDYADASTPDTRTGRLEAEVNVDDVVRLGLRLSRGDELANGFALSRGLQSDRVRLDASSRPVRRLELAAGAERIDYNDHNQSREADLSAGWAFTDHPRTLKLVARAEARDTDEEARYHYAGDRLTDITHPYWTPQDYLAGTLALVWSRDLSERLFCGAERNVYEIRVAGGTDSEHNPSGEVAVSWLFEFAERWSLRASGVVHESEQWDAQSVSLTLGRRF